MAAAYRKIRINRDSTRDEHRLVVEAAIGRRLHRKEVVHHLDGDTRHNSIENLVVMTLKEHSRLHHHNRPSESGAKKLTLDDAIDIRWLRRQGVSDYDIAPCFGLHVKTVQKILRGAMWAEASKFM